MNSEYYLRKDEDIDLIDIWLILKKRWMLIFIITVIFTGVAFSYVLLAPKVYRVHNVLIINQLQDGELFNQSEMAAAVSILDKLTKLNDVERNRIFHMLGVKDGIIRDIKSIMSSEMKGSSSIWVDIDTTDIT